MKFEEIQSFTYFKNIVSVNGIEIQISKILQSNIDAVQYHKNRPMIEELTDKQVEVPTSKYQFALDEWNEKRELELNPLPLSFEELKNIKIQEINQACKKAIISGFKSLAKEIEYKYESDEVDQLNLIGAVTTGVRQNIKCSSDNGVTWQWIDHLSSEVKDVFDDGVNHKNEMLIKASTLKNQVLTVPTVEEINKIVW